MRYYAIVIVIFLIDQYTKHLIKSNMDLYQSIAVADGVFHITYINNYGAAFSILQGRQLFFILVTSIAVLIALIYIARIKGQGNKCMSLSLSLIAGGGLGNLADRICQGCVVDFLDFRVFPIFNVADMAITFGCGILFLCLLKTGKSDA
jgi:signal peptidase II